MPPAPDDELKLNHLNKLLNFHFMICPPDPIYLNMAAIQEG